MTRRGVAASAVVCEQSSVMCRRISSLPTFVSVCERVEMTNNYVGWFMHIAKTTLTHPLFLSLSLSLSLPRRTDALFEKVLCCTTPAIRTHVQLSIHAGLLGAAQASQRTLHVVWNVEEKAHGLQALRPAS